MKNKTEITETKKTKMGSMYQVKILDTESSEKEAAKALNKWLRKNSKFITEIVNTDFVKVQKDSYDNDCKYKVRMLVKVEKSNWLKKRVESILEDIDLDNLDD